MALLGQLHVHSIRGVLSYDPAADQLLDIGFYETSAVGPIYPGVTFMDLVHGSSPQASYSAIPWFGSSFPLGILILGLGGGTGLLLAGILLRSRTAKGPPGSGKVGEE